MFHRGNSPIESLVSFFNLSNTIPDIKRRMFMTIQLLGIFMLVASTVVSLRFAPDWFEIFANIGMIWFLTAMTWLLWHRRDRQELILFIVFFGAAAWLLMVMLYNVIQIPPDTAADLQQIVSPWFNWIILIYLMCFLTFRATGALRISLVISVMATSILLYCMLRVAPFQPTALFDFGLIYLANTIVLLLAFPLARAQEHSALTDFVTDLPNRTQGYNVLVSEIERAQRYGDTFAIILYDIDHFKKINDSCGHPCGDQVLREVSRFACEHVRRTDLLCRWGGEEFLLLMPHTDLASARLKAEHLRLQLKNRPFHKDINLTASFGITVYYPYDSANSMLERVDGALYRAKRNGRNCVESE